MEATIIAHRLSASDRAVMENIIPPQSDVVKSGAFDFTGLLAGLEAATLEMGARLIVFDAIDVRLSLLDIRRRNAVSCTAFTNGSCATN